MNLKPLVKQPKCEDNRKIDLSDKGYDSGTHHFITTLLANISNKLGLSLAIYQK